MLNIFSTLVSMHYFDVSVYNPCAAGWSYITKGEVPSVHSM